MYDFYLKVESALMMVTHNNYQINKLRLKMFQKNKDSDIDNIVYMNSEQYKVKFNGIY